MSESDYHHHIHDERNPQHCIFFCSLGTKSTNELIIIRFLVSRSRSPRGLRRGSAVPRLLELRVPIPSVAWLSLLSVVCCQVEFSVTGRSLVRRSPTECGVSEYDREASIMRRPWPTRGCCTMEKKKEYWSYFKLCRVFLTNDD
jgi:hypothetical protein